MKQIQSQIDPVELTTSVRDDFSVFMEEILDLKNADFHNELDAVISNNLYHYIVEAMPRDHGKSTHLSVGYPAWEIAKDHNLRILLVSSTSTIANRFLNQITNLIERNQKYIEWARAIDPKEIGVIPKMKVFAKKEEKWAGNAITVDRENLNIKEASITAIGLFGSILSLRTDIVICDDIVNHQNSQTEEQRQKIVDWVYTTVMPTLVPGGRFIYLGNTWHPDDLVSTFLKDPQFDYKDVKKAIISEPTNPELWQQWAKIYTNEELSIEQRKQQSQDFYDQNKEKLEEGIKLLWPEKFTYQSLYLKRLANSYSFSRMYQCDPSSNPKQKIKEEWLNEAKRKGAHLKLTNDIPEGVVLDKTAVGIDLAISQKKNSDDTVFVTLDRIMRGNGIINAGDYLVRNIEREKLTPNQTKEKVKDYVYIIKPDGMRVETVAYQESIVKDLMDDGVIISGHRTGNEKNDPDSGINSIGILLEQGKLILPFDSSDPRTIQLVSQLVDELRKYPDGHTGDTFMALWFALLELRGMRSSGRFYIPPEAMNIKTNEQILADMKDPIKRAAYEKEMDLQTVDESIDKRKKSIIW